MAVICNTCGLPEDLCACGELEKDSTHIIIRLETRRFRKKGTMIEGLDPKINDLESVAKELKAKGFENVSWFSTHEDLAKELNKFLKKDDHLLIKGSRGMQMEKVLGYL